MEYGRPPTGVADRGKLSSQPRWQNLDQHPKDTRRGPLAELLAFHSSRLVSAVANSQKGPGLIRCGVTPLLTGNTDPPSFQVYLKRQTDRE